jgi:N,N'-diacetyllegionaminate synthase
MSDPAPVFFIAEAGVNHNGSLDLALRLVGEAARAGADAVKFQSFKAERLVTRSARKAEYQRRTTGGEDTQFEMLRRLELDDEAHGALLAACGEAGITFLSSPFDEQSADLLDELGVPAFKLPSGELTNHPLLRHIAAKGKPIILSTGMATLAEVREAVDVIRAAGGGELSLLHCVTEYPAPFDQVNLRAMLTLRDEFGLPVGYSDHTPGAEVAIAAVALGATIIEKHFTLSRDLPGPDHAASLEPRELAAVVEAVRHVELALGDGVKAPAPCEVKNIAIARKSVVAERDLEPGERVEPRDVAVKRPGDGISPADLERVIGRSVVRPLRAGDVITWQDLGER